MTGYSKEETDIQISNLKIDDYLIKPISRKELIARIKACLELREVDGGA
jgi:DNA-binding response OmpR family regulator